MTDVRVKTEDPVLDNELSKPPLPKALMREVSPLVRLEEFSLSKPNIHDQASDYSRLISALVTEKPRIDRLNLLETSPHHKGDRLQRPGRHVRKRSNRHTTFL